MSQTQDQGPTPFNSTIPFLEDPEARPFWESAGQHRLVAQRCTSCGSFRFPPKTFCPHCLSERYNWDPLSGKGTVYTYVTLHRAWHPAWQDKIPYNVSLIETEEGIRMWSNVLDCTPDQVYVGMKVEVYYEDFEGYSVPRFRPAPGA